MSERMWKVAAGLLAMALVVVAIGAWLWPESVQATVSPKEAEATEALTKAYGRVKASPAMAACQQAGGRYLTAGVSDGKLTLGCLFDVE